MAYCVVGDLLTGDIPLPVVVSATQYVNSAADEIDAALGQVYVTPIVLDVTSPAVRPSALVLKGINAKLASGRIIMAADAGGQDTVLHAYGLSLVREAQATLTELRASAETLPGATPVTTITAGQSVGRGPIIVNRDVTSQVESFYDFFNPVLNP